MATLQNQAGESAIAGQYSLLETIRFCCLIVFVTLGLIGIVAVIVAANPPKKIPESFAANQKKLYKREEVLNYMAAVTLSKSLLTDLSATTWSHAGLDPGTLCIPMHDGIWYAQGTAAVTRADSPQVREKWQLIFLPKNRVPLYFQIDSFEYGNASASKVLRSP